MIARFGGAARAAVLAVLVQLLVAPAAGGQEPEPSPPALGADGLAAGTVVENQADALAHWVARGFTRASLLHIDAHDNLRVIEEPQAAALRALRDKGDAAGLTAAIRGQRPVLGQGDFISAAAALGIVREVCWVVPFRFPEDPAAAGGVRGFLRAAGFAAGDIETFQAEEGCHRGVAGAVPVTICPQERLPWIGEPVLLSLDVDYLLPAALGRGTTVLTEMRALIRALREARYAVRDAVISYSVLEGRTPVELRWAGEALIDLLREPALALRTEPPERWNALQRLTLLRAGGPAKAAEMLNVALSLVERQPHDPALLVFAAEAVVGHGGSETALTYAEEACRLDPGYCPGLRTVGLQLLGQGAVDEAATFFAAAERLLPGISYGQLDEGLLLAQAGRLEQAVAVLEKLMAREGAFPGGFLAGAVHIAAGDRAAARRSYDAALAALKQPHPAVSRAEIVGAIRGAAEFYRREGLVAQAERLERDPGLLPPREASPGGLPGNPGSD